MQRLLMIGDDGNTARQLQNSLRYKGVEVVHRNDSTDGFMLFRRAWWDIVVIAEKFVDRSGIPILAHIRSKDKKIPVIFLISSTHPKDRVRLFRLGASDVLSRPIDTEELVVRVHNLLRIFGTHKTPPSYIQVQDLFIDMRNRTVTRSNVKIRLTQTEFELLLYLAKHAGKALSRQKILSDVWGYDFCGDTNLIDVYIRYLRLKIDKGHKRKLIKTVRGIGYMMDTGSGFAS